MHYSNKVSVNLLTVKYKYRLGMCFVGYSSIIRKFITNYGMVSITYGKQGVQEGIGTSTTRTS
ncbi:hypothetical protein J5U23_00437 [Saccharolobus shibatae B12]|uniref:Uncharacterized protein n=1 Tax=Saccharolobus shibatae (strain ATCC 51178 / DSM 5389 / JCM 8931 / NBRC 15437 / B12) TaxID=523848 RepID=A0A8F5GS93_SACSH|nr:hypothetical protein J5U23_00437 [Saccharolobus shibatae B12]